MIEIMVAFGLAAILLLGVTTTTTMTRNNTGTVQGIMYRDEIVRTVQQISSTPQTLQKTLAYPYNTNLKACVDPPGAGSQNADCYSGQEYPVKLVDMAGAVVTGAAAIPITDDNSVGFPLYYSVMDGSLCMNGATPVVAPDNRCAFEVVTSFVPTCTDPSTFCQDPKKIVLTFRYRVRLASGGNINPLNGAQLKAVVAPPAPLSYVNAMSIHNGYYTN